jgi:cyclin H
MEYHPKLILLTCLFLAAKSENFFISINSFCKRIPKTTPESILALEFEILQSLKFTLMAHHPFRPLYGFFFDIQDTLGTEVTSKDLGKVYDSARSMINDALISDAVFHFTPPQIALACFKSTDEVLTMKYLNKKFDREVKQELDEETLKDQPVTDYETLLQLIDECQEFIRSTPNPTKEQAILVDKKVQFCVNPTLVLKRKREGTAGTEGDQNKRQRTESMEPPLST